MSHLSKAGLSLTYRDVLWRRNALCGMSMRRTFVSITLLLALMSWSPAYLPAGDKTTTVGRLNAAELRGVIRENKGKVVVLCFWSTLSSISREEVVFLDTLYGAGENGVLEIIGVNVEGAEPDVIASFVDMKQIRYPVFVCGDNVIEAYDLQFIPVTFILGKDGRVRHKEIGFSEDAKPRFRKLIQKLSMEE